MMKFVRLTRATAQKLPVYVNASAVWYVEPSNDGTRIKFNDEYSLHVLEDCERVAELFNKSGG